MSATARSSSRWPWKACCANGTTWPGGCARKRRDLKDTDAIEQAAGRGTTTPAEDDWLLPGARLAEAETLAAKPGFRDRLNTAREYLLASRQREDRRTEAAVRDAQERRGRSARRYSRRLKAVLAAVVVVAVAAVFGFGWALKARSDAGARFRDATAHGCTGSRS